MKKLYALLMAAVLMLAVVVPASAATSPVATIVEATSSVATTVEGTAVTALSREVAAEVIGVTETPSVLSDLGVPAEASIVAAVDVTYTGEIPTGGVQISFVVSNAQPGDLVYLLHRQSTAPYQWEVVGSAVLGSDLTVVGTFTSFSPVAVMVVDAENVAATGVKAPKTGK